MNEVMSVAAKLAAMPDLAELSREVERLKADQNRLVATTNGMARVLGGEGADLPRLVDEVVADRDNWKARALAGEADTKGCLRCRHKQMLRRSAAAITALARAVEAADGKL